MYKLQSKTRIMAFALVLGVALGACGAEPDTQAGSTATTNNAVARPQSQPSRVSATSYFMDLALHSLDLQNLILDLPRYGSGLSVDQTGGYSVAVKGKIGVYFPVRGETGRSFLALWYDQSTRQLVSKTIGIFTINKYGNFVVKLEADDKPVLDAVMAGDGRILEGTRYDALGHTETLYPSPASSSADTHLREFLSIGCVNSCLASYFGIPAWVTAAIGLACAGVCAVTDGAGCAFCVGVAIGVGGPALAGEIAYCVATC